MLVHGVAFDPRMWADVVPRLGHGVRAIVYDLRGHGVDAGADPPRDYSQLATDLVRLLDDLGLERAHLAGLSLGAVRWCSRWRSTIRRGSRRWD